MSVYTEVSQADLKPLLAQYQAGELLELSGIRDGIENTNYFVSTRRGDYVLTLFEHATEQEVAFALHGMAQLAARGLPCAQPCADRQGHYLGRLHHKPASLVTRLVGQSIHAPTAAHCHSVGTQLGRLHLAAETIGMPQENPRGARWRQAIACQLMPMLNQTQAALLEEELAYQQTEPAGLPRGIIHADLFRDNVLFDGDRLSGLLDLYNAGRDLLLYDLAITANDWCTGTDGDFDQPRLTALLQAYSEVRPVSPAEQRYWSDLLRRAALRFWLSRLHNQFLPRTGHLTQQKDPRVYENLLRKHREQQPTWPV